MTKPSLLKLFWIFFKIGMVMFGGGYAVLPFLESEICEKEKFCTLEEITDFYALSQCFPGLVAGNVSMFVGYKVRRVRGAISCVLGICLPAFLAIVLVFAFLPTIMTKASVQNMFEVLDVAVCVLIVLTLLELWRFSILDRFTFFLFFISLVASLYGVSPFIVIFGAGALGFLRNTFYKKAVLPCCCSSVSSVFQNEVEQDE